MFRRKPCFIDTSHLFITDSIYPSEFLNVLLCSYCANGDVQSGAKWCNRVDSSSRHCFSQRMRSHQIHLQRTLKPFAQVSFCSVVTVAYLQNDTHITHTRACACTRTYQHTVQKWTKVHTSIPVYTPVHLYTPRHTRTYMHYTHPHNLHICNYFGCSASEIFCDINFTYTNAHGQSDRIRDRDLWENLSDFPSIYVI